MPRQIHLTISKELRTACWLVAKERTVPTSWQEVAREALSAGLPLIENHSSSTAKMKK